MWTGVQPPTTLGNASLLCVEEQILTSETVGSNTVLSRCSKGEGKHEEGDAGHAEIKPTEYFSCRASGSLPSPPSAGYPCTVLPTVALQSWDYVFSTLGPVF